MGKKPQPLDPIFDVLDDTFGIFMGIPKKRKPKEDILSGKFLTDLD